MQVITGIKKISGIAGQFAYTVSLEDEYGDSEVSFIGTSYGSPGPVAMTFDTGGTTFVVDPSRFGDTFNRQWIRNFFEDRS